MIAIGRVQRALAIVQFRQYDSGIFHARGFRRTALDDDPSVRRVPNGAQSNQGMPNQCVAVHVEQFVDIHQVQKSSHVSIGVSVARREFRERIHLGKHVDCEYLRRRFQRLKLILAERYQCAKMLRLMENRESSTVITSQCVKQDGEGGVREQGSRAKMS